MPTGMSPIENASPAAYALLASALSNIFMVSVVLACEAAIAAASRFSGGVRIRPQNAPKIAGATTVSCQSIHWLARARVPGSAGSSEPAPWRPAR